MSKTIKADHLITLCSLANIGTWEKVNRDISRAITAEKYILVVPDQEIQEFESITCKDFEIKKDSEFVSKKITNLARLYFKKRAGWYIQQLIKIEASRKLKHQSEKKDYLNVIYDSDTVALRKNIPIAYNGKLIYRLGREYHRPYHDTIERLFECKYKAAGSFISQVFPIYSSWTQEFCSMVEQRHSCGYQEAIINTIAENSSDSLSKFSEYETLGHWIFNYKEKEFYTATIEGDWFRRGNMLFGPAPKSLEDEKQRIKLFGKYNRYVAIDSYATKGRFNGLQVTELSTDDVQSTEFALNYIRVQNIDIEKMNVKDRLKKNFVRLDCNDKDWFFTTKCMNHIVVSDNVLKDILDLTNFLREIDRILKPGGTLEILIMPAPSNNIDESVEEKHIKVNELRLLLLQAHKKDITDKERREALHYMPVSIGIWGTDNNILERKYTHNRGVREDCSKNFIAELYRSRDKNTGIKGITFLKSSGEGEFEYVLNNNAMKIKMEKE